MNLVKRTLLSLVPLSHEGRDAYAVSSPLVDASPPHIVDRFIANREDRVGYPVTGIFNPRPLHARIVSPQTQIYIFSFSYILHRVSEKSTIFRESDSLLTINNIDSVRNFSDK